MHTVLVLLLEYSIRTYTPDSGYSSAVLGCVQYNCTPCCLRILQRHKRQQQNWLVSHNCIVMLTVDHGVCSGNTLCGYREASNVNPPWHHTVIEPCCVSPNSFLCFYQTIRSQEVWLSYFWSTKLLTRIWCTPLGWLYFAIHSHFWWHTRQRVSLYSSHNA
jgi:hypothetical protein